MFQIVYRSALGFAMPPISIEADPFWVQVVGLDFISGRTQ